MFCKTLQRLNVNVDPLGKGVTHDVKGHLELVKYLIENDAKMGDGDTTLHFACHSGNLDLIKYLVSLCTDVKD